MTTYLPFPTPRQSQTHGRRAAALIADWLAWLPEDDPARFFPTPVTIEDLSDDVITLLVTGYPEDVLKAALAAVWIDKGHLLISPFAATDLAMVAWRWRTGRRATDRAWRERITAEAARIAALPRTVTEGVSA